MKKITFLVCCLILLSSCNTVKVVTDYDTKANFNKYKTFAFYKPGIDKADISSLDKKRVLRAIESELLAQGFSKSDNPDMLVSIFTKSRRKVNINQNNNFGIAYDTNLMTAIARAPTFVHCNGMNRLIPRYYLWA